MVCCWWLGVTVAGFCAHSVLLLLLLLLPVAVVTAHCRAQPLVKAWAPGQGWSIAEADLNSGDRAIMVPGGGRGTVLDGQEKDSHSHWSTSLNEHHTRRLQHAHNPTTCKGQQ